MAAAAEASSGAGGSDSEKVTVGGTEYAKLADGEYDVIVLGTGLKECILAGMLAAGKGKKVLVLDRNEEYGGDCASLNLTTLYQRFNDGKEPPKEYFAALGKDRDYNVDLIPKFMMASGRLVDILLKTGVYQTIEKSSGINRVHGCYIFSQTSNKGFFSSGTPGVEKLPSTPAEAMSSSLLGIMQKNNLRLFLQYVDRCEEGMGPDGLPLKDITARGLYDKFFSKSDAELPVFVGHGLALFADDSYLDRSALELVEAIKLYRDSIMRGGTSPFAYPVYGLSTLPEAFSRLCALQGGVFILRTDVKSVIFEDGKVAGVVARPSFASEDMAARAPLVVADPSYLKPEQRRRIGAVARAICLTSAPPKGIKGTSAQIIIPQQQVGRHHDIYMSCLSNQHCVSPKDRYICIASTTVESKDPVAELKPAIDLLEGVIAKFDSVAESYACQDKPPTDGLVVTGSYDATTHFESVCEDVDKIWNLITGEDARAFSVTPLRVESARDDDEGAAAESSDSAAAAAAASSSS